MKVVGTLLILFGIALLIYVGYLFFSGRNKIISPIPEDTGIKVIFITPGK